jgi:hypothetical protein
LSAAVRAACPVDRQHLEISRRFRQGNLDAAAGRLMELATAVRIRSQAMVTTLFAGCSWAISSSGIGAARPVTDA